MKIKWKSVGLACVAVAVIAIGACGGGGRGRTAFKVTLSGLPAIGNPGPTYEGFALIGGIGVSTGKFLIDDSVVPAQVISVPIGTNLGTVNEATFGPSNTQLGVEFPFIVDADAWFITIEPADDIDPAPTGNFIVGGFFQGNTATFGNVAPLALLPLIGLPSFVGVSGLITSVSPTDGPGADASGLWAVTDTSGNSPGLSLPTLPGTWRYGLWATSGATTLALGTFTQINAADDDFMEALTRGSLSTGFAAPGQDFVASVTVPAIDPVAFNSGDWKVEVTVEPEPDNSVQPLGLTVLSGNIPTTAVNASGATSGFITLTNTAPSWTVDAVLTPGNIALSSTSPATGLQSLGAQRDGAYTVLALVGGLLQSCGSIVVDANGNVFTTLGTPVGTTTAFALNPIVSGLGLAFPDLTQATAVSIHVVPQDAVSPRGGFGSILLAGDVSSGLATLSLSGGTSIPAVGSFATAAGSCILATPTDDAPGVATNDAQGVWFIQPNRQTPSLTLPFLALGWKYAGWVVNTVTGERRPTGHFQYAGVSDDDASTWRGRGLAHTAFPVPGQDFVVSIPIESPSPQIFTSSATWTIRVTVEPTPRATVHPFPMTILQGTAPTSGATVSLTPVPVLLSGSITR